MFHIAIFILLITLVAGSVSLSFALILYSKEKNPLLRYNLILIFLLTVLIATILADAYLFVYHLFPSVVYFLDLLANLTFCVIITQCILKVYPVKLTHPYLIADGIFKVSGILLGVAILLTFFIYKKYFFWVRIACIIFWLTGLAINLLIIFFEKNPIDRNELFNWNLYTKTVIIIHNITFPIYTFIFFISRNYLEIFSLQFKFQLAIPLMLSFSFLSSIFSYLVIQLFSIIFVFISLRKPHYQIKPLSINSDILQLFGFSDREADVVDELLRGMSYKSIGQNLYISLDTVKYHIKNIYRKTGIRKRQELLMLLRAALKSH